VTAKPLTLREISLFFFPLLLNVQMMSVSHSIINAGLARDADFVTALAAFAVAMALHGLLASASYQNHTITIAMVRGRRSLRGTVIFVVLVASLVSLLLATVAFTPVGDFVLGRLLGVSGEIAYHAKAVLGILVFLPFLTGFRGFFQGLVMQARHTALVSLATIVRVVALLGFLALGRRWFSGAELGAFALLACIVIETALMGAFAWHCRIHHEGGADERGALEILKFSFPLAYASCLQQSVPLLINAIIGRLPDGALALASFGVIRGFIFLLAGPMRNLLQAYQTMVKNDGDYRVLVRFFRWVGGALAVVTILIAFPLSGPVLGALMGLDAATRAYIALPLAACALYCYLYGAVSLLRGWFTNEDRTTELGRSVVYKVLFLGLCWGAFLLLPLPVPGVAVAVFLLMAAEICEAWYLHHRRRRLRRAALAVA